MSFLNAKIHVSIFNNYVDFYEENKFESIESNSLKKNNELNNKIEMNVNKNKVETKKINGNNIYKKGFKAENINKYNFKCDKKKKKNINKKSSIKINNRTNRISNYEGCNVEKKGQITSIKNDMVPNKKNKINEEHNIIEFKKKKNNEKINNKFLSQRKKNLRNIFLNRKRCYNLIFLKKSFKVKKNKIIKTYKNSIKEKSKNLNVIKSEHNLNKLSDKSYKIIDIKYSDMINEKVDKSKISKNEINNKNHDKYKKFQKNNKNKNSKIYRENKSEEEKNIISLVDMKKKFVNCNNYKKKYKNVRNLNETLKKKNILKRKKEFHNFDLNKDKNEIFNKENELLDNLNIKNEKKKPDIHDNQILKNTVLLNKKVILARNEKTKSSDIKRKNDFHCEMKKKPKQKNKNEKMKMNYTDNTNKKESNTIEKTNIQDKIRKNPLDKYDKSEIKNEESKEKEKNLNNYKIYNLNTNNYVSGELTNNRNNDTYFESKLDYIKILRQNKKKKYIIKKREKNINKNKLKSNIYNYIDFTSINKLIRSAPDNKKYGFQNETKKKCHNITLKSLHKPNYNNTETNEDNKKKNDNNLNKNKDDVYKNRDKINENKEDINGNIDNINKNISNTNKNIYDVTKNIDDVDKSVDNLNKNKEKIIENREDINENGDSINNNKDNINKNNVNINEEEVKESGENIYKNKDKHSINHINNNFANVPLGDNNKIINYNSNIKNSNINNNDINNKLVDKIFNVCNDNNSNKVDLFEKNSFSSKENKNSKELYIAKNFGLNLNEYTILKEIKSKQDNEIIQLNLDSSFYASKGAGLYNYGQNICFFNSIIQAIIRIPYICKDLLNKLHSLNCEKRKKRIFCFYCLFEQFACNIISKRNVIKNVLIPYIKKYICNSYNIGYQEDVHEYLRYFLCSLEKSSFFSSIYIQKMFTGVTKNVTICMKCNNVSLKYEQYYELSLDISSSNNLEGALKKFLSKEMLMGENGYYCEKCKKKKMASKQCVINKLPRVLTIQIKRFFMNSNYHIVKNHKNISYPLYLDMKYYVNNYDLFENNFNNNVISLYEKMILDSTSKNNLNKNETNFNNFKENKNGIKFDDLNRNQSEINFYNLNKSQTSFRDNNIDKRIISNNTKLRGGEDNQSIHVLKEIENIFTDLKSEVCKKKIEKKLSVSNLRDIIIEKRKLIIKELKKIRFSKFYKDVSTRISKDIDTLYSYFTNNSQNKNFNIKTLLFKYKIDYYENQKNEEIFIKNEKINCIKSSEKCNEKDEKNKKNSLNYVNNYFYYELTGLIKHIGSGTEYGHYIALTKLNNNIYLQCDDNDVSYINEKDILSCVKNAYVFIYTCINPRFIDFYNKYVDVLEKKNFDMNLPVFEKNVEFKERITMPKHKFISKSLYY
ncbi:ubiquitin carboxyl-terminal hydrolase, putative [Plasmodium gallinaceum]|uniref:ubiquitinyl hydrolase 1 n=1 Tax=Plasmodium gallinaceum TaxID=5849 RepID=A0A1J1GT54_PLAGA|nr:ubiquitin carboxyl-terminal hydrolase, putative [Plasmodium gallinaceum]CRG95666.1 ubiquitin carboxyl-terminal hydrolase, putative [Plasmodium gallinaceum]